MNVAARRTDKASLTVDAPASTVFSAFMVAGALKEWLPPPGASAEIEAFEPRPGGALQLTLHFATAPGKTGEHSDRVDATFGEIVPGRSIEWNVRFDSMDHRFDGVMVMTWTFRPLGNATEVEVEARNVPPGVSKADHSRGLNGSLANLASYVERQKT